SSPPSSPRTILLGIVMSLGHGRLAAAAELSLTSHPGLGVASSGLFRGGVSASRIPALRLVDGVDRGERKLRKGQNRIKTGQKREAWRSREK
nr:hypothetical protein [Tanacetum cinerariifolium]